MVALVASGIPDQLKKEAPAAAGWKYQLVHPYYFWSTTTTGPLLVYYYYYYVLPVVKLSTPVI